MLLDLDVAVRLWDGADGEWKKISDCFLDEGEWSLYAICKRMSWARTHASIAVSILQTV